MDKTNSTSQVTGCSPNDITSFLLQWKADIVLWHFLWLHFVNFCTVSHTNLFNGPTYGTTRVSRYQKGKTSLDFTEARDSEWQWHQLGHMQVCTSLQTDNHTSTPPLCFYRPYALPADQPKVSEHWRQQCSTVQCLSNYLYIFCFISC